ncbi:hypothetical protein BDR04DRAFT_1116731 [Suillus decipiens]|nr:hypothetical protein BDR04DRAFT_1116731 [Suillus decipiens]
MVLPTKYSTDQIEFMATYHDQFLESWGQKFPERAVVFKDIPLDVDLTEEQSTQGATAWTLHQQCLMEKFHNDLASSKTGQQANAKTATVNKMMTCILNSSKEKPSCMLKPWEMYSKTHYVKIKDAVKTEQEELKNAPFAEPARKITLHIVKQHLKDAFNNESEEIKAEVLAAVEAMKEMRCTEIEEAKKHSEHHDKDVAHSYISKITTILMQFLEELHEMTDWVFTILMGEPQPTMDGALDISSFHAGTMKLGNRFSQAYPQFSQNIMVPYMQFVEHPSLPTLPMPQQTHETMYDLPQLFQDLDEDLTQPLSLPNITSPPQICHQMQYAPVLTSDSSVTSPSHGRLLPAGMDPTQTPTSSTYATPPSGASNNQTLPAAEAPPTPPIAPICSLADQDCVSDGEKRRHGSQREQSNVPAKQWKANAHGTGTRDCAMADGTVTDHQLEGGRGKHQQIQSKCAAEANNIGGSSVTWKGACK